jgi:cell division protein FtsN
VRALDGTYRVLVGAFETAEQAERADSILDTTDLHGTIVRRAGIAR